MQKSVMNIIIDYCVARAQQAYWFEKRNPDMQIEFLTLAYNTLKKLIDIGKGEVAVKTEFDCFVWGIGVKCAADDNAEGIRKAVVDKVVKPLMFELYTKPALLEEGEAIEERCPNCDNIIHMKWNVKKDGYKAYCPVCGERLMLCSECRTEDERRCNYDLQTDMCWRREG